VSIKDRAKRAKADSYIMTALAMLRHLKREGRDRALFAIGLAAARIGRLDVARDVLDKLKRIRPAPELDEIRYWIASAEALAGPREEARRLARQMSRHWRSAALRDVALSELASGEERAAYTTAASIPDLQARLYTMLSIAERGNDQFR